MQLNACGVGDEVAEETGGEVGLDRTSDLAHAFFESDVGGRGVEAGGVEEV